MLRIAPFEKGLMTSRHEFASPGVICFEKGATFKRISLIPEANGVL